MKYLSFLVIFAVSCSNIRKGNIPDSDQKRTVNEVSESTFLRLSPEAYRSDLIVLKNAIDEALTARHRYCSKSELDSTFLRAINSVNPSTDYLDFTRNVSGIFNLIACGHSGWSHSLRYKAYREKSVRLFPFDIVFEKGKCFIKQDNSLENRITINTELLKINDQPIDSIVKSFSRYMNRDGNSNTPSINAFQKYFSMAYSNFIDNPDHFDILTINPETNQKEQFCVSGLLRSEIDSIRRKRYPVKVPVRSILSYRYDSTQSVGVYKIRRFNKQILKHYNQDFETFNDSVFSDLNQNSAQYLIIDLRGNLGGWTTYGKLLFSYFIDREVPYIESVKVQKYKDYSFDSLIVAYPGYLDTFNLEKEKSGIYSWVNYPNLIARPAKDNRFRGQVYILVNDETRSCSGVFSSLMREHTNAIFVGSETGSTQCGAGGMVLGLELPHTKLRVHFSTAMYTNAIHDKAITSGVMPDFEIPFLGQSTAEDEHIKAVYKLIKNAE